MKCVLGIDIGTTGAKALLLSENRGIFATGSAEYPLITPKPNWAEQNPEGWWEATVSSVRACLEQVITSGETPEVQAIGLTGQMHSSVFLGDDNRVLRPAILWCDQRTDAQCREIVETVGFEQLIGITSNKALTGFTAPKILWVRQNEPEVYSQITRILLPKDYIRLKLTGQYATDVSDASGTLLFDVANRKWSDEMFEALNIPHGWLPECYESIEVTGRISKEAGEILGLSEGTPVVGGGGDQAAGAVGNGIVTEGMASCVLGTSGVVFWHSDTHISEAQGRLHSFCHAVPGKWHLMGVTLAAGGSLRWFRDTLCQKEIEEGSLLGIDSYRLILEKAASIAPGSEGLIFLPYLAGERTPHADSNARSAFIGLSLRHTKEHMARAVLEGITMSLKDCLELGNSTGLDPKRMLVSGGGARSELWLKMIADVFEIEVARAGAEQGPAYGAGILATVGAGFYESVESACDALVHSIDSKMPDICASQEYRDLYGLYKPLYATLREHFERCAAYVSRNPLPY